jgi:hypothetical protein
MKIQFSVKGIDWETIFVWDLDELKCEIVEGSGGEQVYLAGIELPFLQRDALKREP